jgi:predicted Ser/Thr protein kinase
LAARFPGLEILELLGQGGMGAVYKARQPNLDRMVALKILSPSLAADPAFAERFTREARALARLSHPNIVSVHDFGQAGDLYYFIMEYVDGVSLRQLERRERLEPAQALAIVPQVCEALQFAHDQGVVHRDIKPENILLDKKGRVKIADFGLAKLLGRGPADFTLTQPQQVMGTVHYMAPEQMEHPAEVDQRADIYSLGVVFYEMLTGELPLGRFAPPSQRVQVDVRLDEVVLKALEKEPERRYQQASQVKTDVEQISGTPQAPAGGRGPQAPAAVLAPQAAGAAPAPSAQKPRSAVAIVAIVLAIVGILPFAAGLVLMVVAGFGVIAALFLTAPVAKPSIEVTMPAAARVPPSPSRVEQPKTEVRKYALDNLQAVITKSGVELDQSAAGEGRTCLKVTADAPTVVRLFETGPLDAENARLTYQARVRTENVEGQVYLEMWCHFPDQGEFFSRGLDKPLTGTTAWTTVETPFVLKQGQKPDNVKLNLVITGKGTAWIDDIRLLEGPLD